MILKKIKLGLLILTSTFMMYSCSGDTETKNNTDLCQESIVDQKDTNKDWRTSSEWYAVADTSIGKGGPTHKLRIVFDIVNSKLDNIKFTNENVKAEFDKFKFYLAEEEGNNKKNKINHLDSFGNLKNTKIDLEQNIKDKNAFILFKSFYTYLEKNPIAIAGGVKSEASNPVANSFDKEAFKKEIIDAVKKETKSSMMPYILSIAALALAALALLMKKSKEPVTVSNAQSQEDYNSLLSKVSALEQMMNKKSITPSNTNIEEQLNGLKRELATLKNELTNLQVKVPIKNNEKSNTIELEVPATPITEQMFFKAPTDSIFFKGGVKMPDKNSSWVVEFASGSNKGIYRHHAGTENEKMMAQMYETFLVREVDILNAKEIANPQGIQIVENGEVERIDGGWKISKKAKVRLV